MFEKGYKGEVASKQDYEHFKGYTSYEELVKNEFKFEEGQTDETKHLPADLIEKMKRKLENDYVKKLASRKTDFASQEFSKLEGVVILNNLADIEEYHEYKKDIESEATATNKIVEDIKVIREKFFNRKIFVKRRIDVVDSKKGYEKKFNKISKQQSLIYDANTHKIERPSYSEKKIEINKLFHWIPEELVKIVQKQGLVPAFLNGLANRFYVYASLERNLFWPENINYPRFEFQAPRKFIELEIDYDDSLEAYLWFPFGLFFVLNLIFAPDSDI